MKMEIPAILKELKNEHFLKEISKYQEDLGNLILESFQKGLLRGIKQKSRIPELAHNEYINRINNFFPKTQDKLDFYWLLAAHAGDLKCKINIPTTLLKINDLDMKPYLIYTDDRGFVCSKKSDDQEFFGIFEGINENFPVFCLKQKNQCTKALFSLGDAISAWEKAEYGSFIQYFIKNQSNPATILRLLWRKNMKSKYFIINNKNKYQVKNRNLPKISQDFLQPDSSEYEFKEQRSYCSWQEFSDIRNKSDTLDVPYHKINQRSSQLPSIGTKPINIPKIRNFRSHSLTCLPHNKDLKIIKSDEETDIDIFNNELLAQTSILSKVFKEEETKHYFVITKNPESCFATESYRSIPEIEKIMNKIVIFLNTFVFNNQNQLKGIVIDFMQDYKKDWIILDYREHSIEISPNLCPDRRKVKKQMLGIKKSQSFSTLQMPDEGHFVGESEHNSNMNDVQTMQSKRSSSLKKKNGKSLFNINLSEDFQDLKSVKKFSEAIKVSQFIRIKKFSLKESGSISNKAFGSSQFNSLLRANKNPNQETRNNILWKEPSYSHVRKHFVNIVNNFDEMVTCARVSKYRQVNLVEKYGGIDFWNHFLLSLYQKVLANEILNKHFKATSLENFEKIIKGMFRFFSGNVNLEFRRKIRAVHLNLKLKIAESEFNLFAEIFIGNMMDFNVSEEDRDLIIVQLKSMKGLIAR
ncbi:unnamed protein product [Blepharisma stoltei]|uniref:Uncharacterized protein n=1 Tax=Blepharisma stoltei TaxID=1481888 RepID=A0AAU9K7W3_9CILI|nr:unnamed protein product [Blepharisma stoltei]